ncbi:MAG: hypothetical protein NT141_01900 [candidate division WWE3 bacterium]|nr:hypothetical protein [candidate division WWE3 bacterium]
MSGAAAGAAAAAAAAARMRQEEEEMTTYTPEDLNNGWEFKILRANRIGGFKDPLVLKKALDEEAQTGWQLVEKFDDYRLRLKRKISERSKDSQATSDPYRTIYGMSTAAMFWLVMGGTLGFTALIILIAFAASGT